MLVDAETAAPGGQLCDACGSPLEPLDRFCPACGSPHEVATTAALVAAAPVAAEQGASPRIASQPNAPLSNAPLSNAPPSNALPSSALPSNTASQANGPALEAADDLSASKFFRCQKCAAEVRTEPDQRSYVCPFCDSTYVVEFRPEETGRQRPEFIIGFGVTSEAAHERFHAWFRDNGWFRPGDLVMNAVVEKMRGVYLPFWSFTMLAQSDWAANVGEYWYRTETYTERDEKGNTVTRTRQVQETEWWPLAGRHHSYQRGYLVSASRGLSQSDADSIQPFQLPALRRYEPYFLAGWLCEEYSVVRDEALRKCQQVFYDRESQQVAQFLPGNTHSNLEVRTQFSRISSDLILLPVYVLSYHYHGKLYRFVMNGQTGRFVGNKPVSWTRVLVAVGLAAAAVALAIGAAGLISSLLK